MLLISWIETLNLLSSLYFTVYNYPQPNCSCFVFHTEYSLSCLSLFLFVPLTVFKSLTLRSFLCSSSPSILSSFNLFPFRASFFPSLILFFLLLVVSLFLDTAVLTVNCLFPLQVSSFSPVVSLALLSPLSSTYCLPSFLHCSPPIASLFVYEMSPTILLCLLFAVSLSGPSSLFLPLATSRPPSTLSSMPK